MGRAGGSSRVRVQEVPQGNLSPSSFLPVRLDRAPVLKKSGRAPAPPRRNGGPGLQVLHPKLQLGLPDLQIRDPLPERSRLGRLLPQLQCTRFRAGLVLLLRGIAYTVYDIPREGAWGVGGWERSQVRALGFLRSQATS
jgi:hypothetical protein